MKNGGNNNDDNNNRQEYDRNNDENKDKDRDRDWDKDRNNEKNQVQAQAKIMNQLEELQETVWFEKDWYNKRLENSDIEKLYKQWLLVFEIPEVKKFESLALDMS